MTVCAWRSPTLTCTRENAKGHAYCYPHFKVLPIYYQNVLMKAHNVKTLTSARALAAEWVTKFGTYWDDGAA